MMIMQTETPETPTTPEDGTIAEGAETTEGTETVEDAGNGTGAGAEFFDVPVALIETGAQVRKGIDPEGESIRALADSIRAKGVIQPLTVCRSGDGYFLVVGERRLLAARLAGLTSVPVRVIPTIQQREDSLSLQLIENLQREDLNPMDMAEGLFEFFQARHGAISMDEIINACITWTRDPERLPIDVASTVDTTSNLTGKSISSLRRAFETLRLPEELREALRTGQIGVTQGYIFCEFLDNPELLSIFRSLLAAPVANEKLRAQLEAYARRTKIGRPRTYRPFIGISASIKAADATLGDATKPVTRDDLTHLRDELAALAAKVETRLAALSAEESETPAEPASAPSAGQE